MAITSNLLIQTQVGKADTAPLVSILDTLRQIDQLMTKISGNKITVDVTLSGNATQQIQNIQQQINKVAGRSATGGGSKITLPISSAGVDKGTIVQVTAQTGILRDQMGEVAKQSQAIQRATEALSDQTAKAVVTTRELRGEQEIITKTIAKRVALGAGTSGETKIVVQQFQKINDLSEQANINQAKAAQNRERSAQAGFIAAKKEVDQLKTEGFTASIKESSSAFATFRKAINDTEDDISKVNLKTGETIDKTRENRDRVEEVNRSLAKQIGAIEAAKNQVTLLNNGFKQGVTSVQSTTRGVQRITEFSRVRASPLDLIKGTPQVDIARVNQETGKLTLTTLEGAKAARLIGDNFLSAAGKVVTWIAATSAVFGSIQLIKEAVKQTVELQANTITLARVGKGFADSTTGQIQGAEELTSQLISLSQFYGTSATEAQQAATIFARSGLSVQQTAEATKVALLASRIAEISVVDAARLFSAELSQFKLSADQLLPSLDRLNTLSNNYRVTTNDLLQSLSRAGSVFAEQGRSETELTSLTAILSQTTARSGAEIGTALKTIVSNLERTDVANKLLEKTGVAFQDAAGSTGDFNATLATLSLQLDKLNRLERNNIVIGTAGVRQRNIFEAALRGSTDALIAELTVFSETGSATKEFKLQAVTLAAAIDRLGASFTKLVSQTDFATTLTGVVDTLDSVLKIITAIGETGILKLSGLLAIFVAVKGVIATYNTVTVGAAIATNFLSTSQIAATASATTLAAAETGVAVAATASGAAIQLSNPIILAISVAILALFYTVRALTDITRENSEELKKNISLRSESTKNTLDAARAERDLTQRFSDQITALRENKAQLDLLREARVRNAQSKIQPGQQGVPGRPAPPTEQETLLAERAKTQLENIRKIGQALGFNNTQIDKAIRDQEELNLIQQKNSQQIENEIRDAERDIKLNNEDLEIQKAKRDELQKQREEIKGIEDSIRRQKKDAAERGFIENLFRSFSSGESDIEDFADPKRVEEFKESFKKAQEEVDGTTTKTRELINKVEELKKQSETLALAEKARIAQLEFKQLRTEIEAISHSFQLFSGIGEALGIDKAKAKQQELNKLLEIDLRLLKLHNDLVEKQPDKAKEIARQLEETRKIQIDIRTEIARIEVERLGRFIQDTINGAFQTSLNISRRTTVAQRRFFELGEELDQLHELGAAAHITQTAVQNLFTQAAKDSDILARRLKELTDRQHLAAVKTLIEELNKPEAGSLVPVASIAGRTPEQNRRRLERLLRSRTIPADAKNQILDKANRSATEVGPSEVDRFLITKIQSERQEAAKRLNELADIQLKIAEELVAKQAEVTAEMRQQTKEQIKQLGLLSEEDKLRVLAQAAFFAANPNAQISATQQFLAPAEVNRIGQEFFSPHLAKQFENEKEPIGQLFFNAGFGNERTRQLRESQAELKKRRDEFTGKPGASDLDVIQRGISQAEHFRREALKVQETLMREFTEKAVAELSKAATADLITKGVSPIIASIVGAVAGRVQFNQISQIPGAGGNVVGPDGKVINQATKFPEITFIPKVNLDPLIEGVNKTIDAGLIKMRERLLEFTREILRLDIEKSGRNSGKIIGPPGLGIGQLPNSPAAAPTPGPIFPPGPSIGSRIWKYLFGAIGVGPQLGGPQNALASVGLPPGFAGVLAQQDQVMEGFNPAIPGDAGEKHPILRDFMQLTPDEILGLMKQANPAQLEGGKQALGGDKGFGLFFQHLMEAIQDAEEDRRDNEVFKDVGGLPGPGRLGNKLDQLRKTAGFELFLRNIREGRLNFGLGLGRGAVQQAVFQDIGGGEVVRGVGGPGVGFGAVGRAFGEGPAKAGVALRGHAFGAQGLRGPGNAGVALRAPGGIFDKTPVQIRREQEVAALQFELEGRLDNFIPGVIARGAVNAQAQEAVKGRIQNIKEGKIEFGSPEDIKRRGGGPLGDPVEAARIQAKIDKQKEGKIQLPDGTLLDPVEAAKTAEAIRKSREGKIEGPRGEIIDPVEAAKVDERIKAIKEAGIKVNISKEGSVNNLPSPSSPYGRVQEAIRQQRELEKQRRKEAFEEARRKRAEIFNNRGEQFVQDELARRGLSGGGAVENPVNAAAPGNIPGVPGSIGPAPFFRPTSPLIIGAQPGVPAQPGQFDQPRIAQQNPNEIFAKDLPPNFPPMLKDFLFGNRDQNKPVDINTLPPQAKEYFFGNKGKNAGAANNAPGQQNPNEIAQNQNPNQPPVAGGSVVHPQIDWGPILADFEVRFGQVLVNAFSRAAPIFAQQLEQAINNSLAAKPAKFRNVG